MGKQKEIQDQPKEPQLIKEFSKKEETTNEVLNGNNNNNNEKQLQQKITELINQLKIRDEIIEKQRESIEQLQHELEKAKIELNNKWMPSQRQNRTTS